MKVLMKADLEKEIALANTKLREPDERAIHLWERIRIVPELWTQTQYSGGEQVWVIAVMGHQCLYYNFVEGGWGWGHYKLWGEVCEFHWEQLDIHHVVFQTLFAIDHGGKG